MKIERIETTAISVTLPRDFRGSVYSVPQKNCILTRIFTSDGVVGECVNGEGAGDIQLQQCRIIQQELAPMLLGQDPTRIEALWPLMWRATSRGGRDPRAAVRAVACLDSALWDVLGKVAGLPLWRLWGGAHEALPVICIGGQYQEGAGPEVYAEEMAALQAEGMAGCKFKVGGATPEHDAARTRAAREAAGEDFILCPDANRAWRRSEALDYARRAAPLGLRWFEEPVLWANDRRDMALLRGLTGIPICAGQSESTAEDCRDLIVDGAVDVCNLDASWGGGPTAWLRVAKLAACFGVEMAHHGEPILGAHLLGAVANATYVEVHHRERDPAFWRMAEGRGDIRDGLYHLPAGPGFGLSYDQGFVDHYKVG